MTEAASKPKGKPKKSRMTLDLTSETKRIIEELAVSKHGNQSAVLREAILLYKYATDAKKEGKTLALIEGDRVVELHFLTL